MTTTFKSLFSDSQFEFNNTKYNNKSYAMAYYDLVKDVLEGKHGQFASKKDATYALGRTICLNYEELPESVLKYKLYKPLNDIYVVTNKDIKGFNSAIQRISKTLNVEVVL